MSGFHPAYVPIQVIDPGISSYDLGAVPSSWQLCNNSVTPGDGAVAANDVPPNSHVFRQSQAAVHGFTLYYQDRFIRNGRTPHRASATLRTYFSATPPGFAGGCYLVLVYGSRFNSDDLFSKPVIYIEPFLSAQGVGSVFCGAIIEGDEFRVSVLTKAPPFSPVGTNVYHRVGIEVLGRTVNFYFNRNASSDPSGVAGNDRLALIYTRTLVNPRGMEGPTVFLGAHPSGHLTFGGNWSGYGDAVLEELEGPLTPEAPPGTGGGGFPKPIFRPFSGDFSSVDFPYIQFKTIRELQNSFKNLVVGA